MYSQTVTSTLLLSKDYLIVQLTHFSSNLKTINFVFVIAFLTYSYQNIYNAIKFSITGHFKMLSIIWNPDKYKYGKKNWISNYYMVKILEMVCYKRQNHKYCPFELLQWLYIATYIHKQSHQQDLGWKCSAERSLDIDLGTTT